MRKIGLGLLLCVSVTSLMAQQAETADAKANSILQSLSKKTKTYKTIKAGFSVTVYGKDKKVTDNQKGNLTVKGGKYKLELKNQNVISDSTTVWTYLKDANEVQINNADHSGDKGTISPTNIFTVYENGFKSHFDKEDNLKGAAVDVIDLYPKHPEREKYHTLILVIDKTKNQIVSVSVMMKDGTVVTYTVDSLNTETTIPDSFFSFNPKDYPGIDVEDLRE